MRDIDVSWTDKGLELLFDGRPSPRCERHLRNVRCIARWLRRASRVFVIGPAQAFGLALVFAMWTAACAWVPTSPTTCSACIWWSMPTQPGILIRAAARMTACQSSRPCLVPGMPTSAHAIEAGHGLMPEALRESELCSILGFRFGDS